MSTRSLDQEIIGVGWGGTVAQVIDHFISTTDVNVRPATLIGGLNGHSNLSPHLATAKLAVKMNMEFSQILSPAIVESRDNCKHSQKGAFDSLCYRNRRGKPKLLLISLGNLDSNSSIVTNGVIDATTYRRLREKGAVGEILGHFFNDKGDFIEDEIDNRVIGVSKKVFENRHNTIICVAEATKKRAIMAALHAGLIDVLVSDEETAKYILPEHTEKIDIHRAEEELMGK
ncbi:MAG: sugar-binding domain-containing protein [Spirochaetia bacterium]|nr:sugar-binding domain-containing protein [Spirochaetia bacterium]